MDNFGYSSDLSLLCRVCLEKAPKMYPLIGDILNVEVNVLTMIAECTSIKVEIGNDLPKGVCIPCFKTIRIAYNFIKDFKKTNTKLEKLRAAFKLRDENNDEADIEQNTNSPCKEDTFSDSEEIESPENTVQESDVDKNDDYDEDNFDDDPEIKEEIIITYSEDFDDNDTNIETIVEETQNDSETEQLEEIEHVNIKTEEVSSNAVFEQSTKKKGILKVFTCPICRRKFTRFEAIFTPHLLTHEGVTLKCHLCSHLPRMEVEAYLQHYSKLHLYQCHICNKSFNNKSSQYYHMKTHEQTKIYSCTFPNCNKSFAATWTLKQHLGTHSDIPRYICSKCGKNFKTYDTFRYHQKTHDGKRNFLCPECGQSFLQSVHLKYHMWKHTGIKRFRCEKCEKSYTSVTQLKKHLRKYCGFGGSFKDDKKDQESQLKNIIPEQVNIDSNDEK